MKCYRLGTFASSSFEVVPLLRCRTRNDYQQENQINHHPGNNLALIAWSLFDIPALLLHELGPDREAIHIILDDHHIPAKPRRHYRHKIFSARYIMECSALVHALHLRCAIIRSNTQKKEILLKDRSKFILAGIS